jgi:AmmeMemoRadiSam system protein B
MMAELFDSLTAPIPPLRDDLELLPYQKDGEELRILRDPSGYSEQMLVFRPAAMALLRLFDGRRSIQDLRDGIHRETGTDLAADQLLDIVRSLDRYHFLANARFTTWRDEHDAEYLARDRRPAAHAGHSYPEDPEELADFLHDLFAADGGAVEPGRLLGVICPHIDLQIGPQVYVPAFRQLASADVDTVVVLGTSHYSAEDLFILTAKDFVTPLGTMRTDREFVELLHTESGGIFTRRDVAHRQEHSIEFPVVFLQHVFGNDRVRLVPILCTSFEEFLVEGRDPGEDERYTAFLRAFHAATARLGRKVAFVLSVDWSHVGRKFGDDVDAADVLVALEKFDREQLTALERCDAAAFRTLLRDSRNATKIDGFSCITTFFDLAQPRRGVLFDYQQWHEEERASAVTFASMAFFADDVDQTDDGDHADDLDETDELDETDDMEETP